MSGIKHSILVMLIVGSTSAFAGSMGPVCTSGEVTIPCVGNDWDIGLYALYLQPSYNGSPITNDGTLKNFNYFGSVDSDNETFLHDRVMGWQWGFKLEAAYRFNSGNDANINWYHWQDTTKERRIRDDGFEEFVNITLLQPKVKADFNAVNVEFGQSVNLDQFKTMRLQAGMQYAQLTREETIISTNTSTLEDGSLGIEPLPIRHFIDGFNGVGPRVGVDLAYSWIQGLGFYANGAVGILIGKSKYYINEFERQSRASFTAIIPELEAKAGATFTYAMIPGDIKLNLGYMVVNYFRPYKGVDFGLQGPYVGLKWMANV